MAIYSEDLKKILREIPSLNFAERRHIYEDLKGKCAGGLDVWELKRYLQERYRDKSDMIDPEEINNILDQFEKEFK